ncbi:aldehyde dehydrogenase family protein, partial [Klebsiella pneumoniae]|uniref:aldehyde dehydrogenase family protein n=1 Tax=Klebsiella pneumoniae TaxID=573 RepID=UPI00272FD0A8
MITKAQQEKVCGYIDSAEQQGATIVVDGRDVKVPGHEAAIYVGGTLIDRVTPEMTCYQEEIFGPALLVMRVDTMEEAMQLID